MREIKIKQESITLRELKIKQFITPSDLKNQEDIANDYLQSARDKQKSSDLTNQNFKTTQVKARTRQPSAVSHHKIQCQAFESSSLLEHLNYIKRQREFNLNMFPGIHESHNSSPIHKVNKSVEKPRGLQIPEQIILNLVSEQADS